MQETIFFIGKDAGESFNYSPATFGKRNIHIGTEAGFANQVRSDNISIGYFSMKSNTLGVPPLLEKTTLLMMLLTMIFLLPKVTVP